MPPDRRLILVATLCALLIAPSLFADDVLPGNPAAGNASDNLFSIDLISTFDPTGGNSANWSDAATINASDSTVGNDQTAPTDQPNSGGGTNGSSGQLPNVITTGSGSLGSIGDITDEATRAVPEPGTCALIGLALCAIGLRLRRRT